MKVYYVFLGLTLGLIMLTARADDGAQYDVEGGTYANERVSYGNPYAEQEEDGREPADEQLAEGNYEEKIDQGPVVETTEYLEEAIKPRFEAFAKKEPITLPQEREPHYEY